MSISKHLIIDANLLVLLIIGSVEGGRHIKNSKRLKAFTRSDYENVVKIMANYDDVYVTPYLAAEVSNLIDLKGYARELAFAVAQQLFGDIFKQIDVELVRDCRSEFFSSFGLADSSLINLAPDYAILTNDHRLLEPLFAASETNIIPYYRRDIF